MFTETFDGGRVDIVDRSDQGIKMVSKRRMLDFENQKIQNAQNSIIVIRQGLRVIKSVGDIYEKKDLPVQEDLDIRRTLVPGETYLFLLAAAQFSGGINHGECSPFILTDEKLEAIAKLRNIWEHRSEYELTGPNAFDGLHPANKKWMKKMYSENEPGVFKVSHFPAYTKIGEYVHVEEVIREAQNWHELVFHERAEEILN